MCKRLVGRECGVPLSCEWTEIKKCSIFSFRIGKYVLSGMQEAFITGRFLTVDTRL